MVGAAFDFRGRMGRYMKDFAIMAFVSLL